jgi:hypothetical protein
MLLDAAVLCRKEGKAAGQGVGESDITDAVAEGGLACLEILLSKCRLTSVNQVINSANLILHCTLVSSRILTRTCEVAAY